MGTFFGALAGAILRTITEWFIRKKTKTPAVVQEKAKQEIRDEIHNRHDADAVSRRLERLLDKDRVRSK